MPEHITGKLGLAWGGYGVTKWLDVIGIHTWSDFAGMVAGIYTTLLIGEWFWKKAKARRAGK